MNKLFCSSFFVVASLACFSLGMQSLQASCGVVNDNAGVGSGTEILNDDIEGYNAYVQVCSSPIQFNGSITLTANVTPITATGTLFFNTTSNTFYTITGSGSSYQALQTTTSGVSLELSQYLAIENAPITIGPGSLQFNDSQSWTGTTTGISQINLGSNGTIEFYASGTVNAPISLNAPNAQGSFNIDVKSGYTVTQAGVISDLIGAEYYGVLYKLGGGTLVLEGANTYSGGTVFSSGNLVLANSSALGTGSLTMSSGRTLTLNSGMTIANSILLEGLGNINILGAVELLGIISGTGSLVVAGNGSLVLGGTNTYSGGTLFQGGELVLTNSAGLGTGSLTMSSGCTLTLNSGKTTANSILLEGLANINMSGGGELLGIISGTGSLVVVGPGTLVLGGTNTYSGGTLLNTGNLVLANSSALGTGSLTIMYSGTATLTLNGGVSISNDVNLSTTEEVNLSVVSGTATISGVISGSNNALNKFGAGTLVLAGTNTFSGEMIILLTAGNLVVTNSSALPSTTGNNFTLYSSETSINLILGIPSGSDLTINTPINLELDVDFETETIVPGVIQVPSGVTATISSVINPILIEGIDLNPFLVFQGPGTLNLTGDSSVTPFGGFEVTGGGTLNSSTYTASQGDISVGSGASLTLSGGFSAYELFNEGTATLQSTSGYCNYLENYESCDMYLSDIQVTCDSMSNYGTITLEGGQIFCDSTSNVYGTVTGTGVISADKQTIYDNGFVSPGNSPGVLTFIAATEFLSGSTMSIYIDPVKYSELVVVGDLTLESGVSLEFRPEPGCYANGQRYEFLTVENGTFSGTFSSVDMGTYLLTPLITYEADGASLTVNRTDLRTLVTGSNALEVAKALQSKVETDAALCNSVGKLILASKEEISSVFNEMQPSQFKALVISQENSVVRVRDTLSYRMQIVLDGMHCQTLFAKEDSEKTTKPCSNDQKAFHAWVDGMGDSFYQKSLYFAGSPQVGYNQNMGGVVAGFDYHFAKTLYAGVLGAYTDSTLKWKESRGKGSVESGYAGVYFSALGEMFYGNASVIGSWNSFSAHRNINFPLEVVTAKNNHGGVQLLSHVDTGINLGWGGFTLRPFDSFDYITGTENGYTETGAAELDLKVDESNSILLRNELGLDFAGCFCMTYGTWRLSPKISWVREVRIKGSEYTAKFEGTETPFTVEGFFPDRSLVSPGVSLTGSFMEDLLTVGLYYNGEFDGNYSDHSYGGQVRFGF